MTNALRRSHPNRTAVVLLGTGALLLVVLGVFAGSEEAAARAYLAGWTFWIGLSAGSMALLLVAAITGGRWVEAARPVLAPMAAAMPLIALAALPIFFTLPDIYSWAGVGIAAKRQAVESSYLNATGFTVRAVIVLAIWSALAEFVALFRPSSFAAAIGLIAYAVMLSFASVDWTMSIDPLFASTAFPAMTAISQIASAISLVAIAQGARGVRAEPDVAGLLMAAVLGMTYLVFIQGLVLWSGNIPDRVDWYVRRFDAGWEPLLVTATAIGVVLPFFMLLCERVRWSSLLTAIAATGVLGGLALHTEWLLAPLIGLNGSWHALFAIIGLGALVLAVAAWSAPTATRRGEAHV